MKLRQLFIFLLQNRKALILFHFEKHINLINPFLLFVRQFKLIIIRITRLNLSPNLIKPCKLLSPNIHPKLRNQLNHMSPVRNSIQTYRCHIQNQPGPLCAKPSSSFQKMLVHLRRVSTVHNNAKHPLYKPVHLPRKEHLPFFRQPLFIAELLQRKNTFPPRLCCQVYTIFKNRLK